MNDVKQQEPTDEEERRVSLRRQMLPGLMILLMAVVVLGICWALGLFDPQVGVPYGNIVHAL